MVKLASIDFEMPDDAATARRRSIEGGQVAFVEDFSPPKRRREDREAIQEDRDASWASAHLRRRDGVVLLDLANVLRVFERHPNFRGRFMYDQPMGKVLDRGSVLMAWQIDALAAEIQERFLPEMCEQTVFKALIIAANRQKERTSQSAKPDCN